MKRYEAYRPTKYEWLTEVPTHWQTRTMRSLTTVSSERRGNREATLLSVYREYGVIVKSSRDDNHNVESEDLSNYKWVRTGDLVMNKMKMWQGSLGVSEFDGIVSPAYIVCHINNENVNRRYLHMLLRSPCYKTYYNQFSYGIRVGQWDMHYEDFKGLEVALPPREEQDQIVRYLDWQVSKINRLIAAKRKQIALLKDNLKSAVAYYTTHGLGNHELCQSEIYWLTHYPNDWRVTKLRYILEKHRREVTPNAELLICSNSGEVIKRGDGKLGLVASSDDIYQGVTAGDLLIHGMDTWHGAIAISSFDGMCTPVVHVCTCKEEKRYVAYYLKMMAYTKVFKAISNGVRQNTSDFRSWDKVGDLLICLPEHDEQVAIADKLDHLTAQTKAGISIFEKQIEHLQELRTHLISDVVTGQVDVRGIEVPEYEYVSEVSETNDNDEDELEDNEEAD